MNDENELEDEFPDDFPDDGEAEGGAGVREPRRSPPSRGGSAVEAEREPEFVASWYF